MEKKRKWLKTRFSQEANTQISRDIVFDTDK